MELYRQYEFKLKEIESLDKEQSRIRLGISSFENKKNENSMVKSELALLEEGDIVYKLIGPILVKQDIGEAKLQVDSRLEMIQKEINKLERNYRENAAIEVFFEMDTSMETIEKIRDEISKIDGVTSTLVKTGKDALEEMQSKFPDEANIINGYGEETFPNSIIIKIENPENNQYVEEEIKKIESNVAQNSIEEMSNGYYYYNKDIQYFDNLSEEEIDQFIEMMKIE